MKTIKILLFLTLMFTGASLSAQRERVAARHSTYRPAKVVVYHPAWHPHYDYHRRWVYFPKYNFYWDNWRNHYVYWNGSAWLSQPTAPAFVANVDLSKERRQELNESEDDNDDIYQLNDTHKSQYK